MPTKAIKVEPLSIGFVSIHWQVCPYCDKNRSVNVAETSEPPQRTLLHIPTSDIMPRHPTHRTPLERKLELLEARFSQDPVGGSSSAHSQHSFSFDGAAHLATSLLSTPTVAGNSRSNASKGFDRVQRAAERHLSKVQQKVVVWASDTSDHSGSATATIVADNRAVPGTPQRHEENEKTLEVQARVSSSMLLC